MLQLLKKLAATFKDHFAGSSTPPPVQVDPPVRVPMTQEDEEHLIANIDFQYVQADEHMPLFNRFDKQSRENFALKTNSIVIYMPDEVVVIKQQEEEAALKAAPSGYRLNQLNGINVGCGDRRVNDHIIPVDILREPEDIFQMGSHHAFLKDAILANPEDLPFKTNSLDYIIALHMLEHISNPIEILKYWGEMLKPGGGIGLILPNYHYTWNAHKDTSKFGHKWNSDPEIFARLYNQYLSDDFILEEMDTMPHKISFDVVLRKPGNFVPFTISDHTNTLSGAELARTGQMVSDRDGDRSSSDE